MMDSNLGCPDPEVSDVIKPKFDRIDRFYLGLYDYDSSDYFTFYMNNK